MKIFDTQRLSGSGVYGDQVYSATTVSLTGATTTQGNLSLAAAATQWQVMVGAPSSAGAVSATGVISQVHSLAGASSASSGSSSTGVISQVTDHTLSASSTAQSNVSPSISLKGAITIRKAPPGKTFHFTAGDNTSMDIDNW